MDPWKVLTVSQPFASTIASGNKWIENRSQRTHYRGPLIIQAGVGTQYLTREEREQIETCPNYSRMKYFLAWLRDQSDVVFDD